MGLKRKFEAVYMRLKTHLDFDIFGSSRRSDPCCNVRYEMPTSLGSTTESAYLCDHMYTAEQGFAVDKKGRETGTPHESS